MRDPILLVGTGYMAIEYAKIFKHLGYDLVVVGRGLDSAQKFKDVTGLTAFTGGIEDWLKNNKKYFSKAVVAVTVTELKNATISLIKSGFQSILVEKPCGVNAAEIYQVAAESKSRNAKIYVAYNRRFYASTQKAKEIIDEDGGVLSFNFEFTEWSHIVGSQKIAKEILDQWFLANSSHVVDMAFFLGGKAQKISTYCAGSLPWHPSASIFAGAGVAENGALFSYQSNWEAPGRWGVEVLTRKHRLIFRPLEELHIQEIGSVAINKIELDNHLDKKFKPGLYKQVEQFLQGNSINFLMIEGQANNLSLYKKICPAS